MTKAVRLAFPCVEGVHVSMNANSPENMREAIWRDIERLQTAPLKVLKQRYRDLFGEPPRVNQRHSVLRRIAWRLQVLAEGDLSERARQRAADLASDAELRLLAPRDFLPALSAKSPGGGAGASRNTYDRRIPAAGTVLTRQYKDRLISATVLQEGFECEGRRYKSLSAIATQKTGTRWNGLVFFGLDRTRGGRHGSR
jgi:hypothetical protein